MTNEMQAGMPVRKYRISKAMRLFFLVSGSIIWAGIGLTGFDTVHWLLYIPAVFFAFAVVTGICPGLIISRLILGEERPDP
ncbi:MAG: hypothetical protein KJ558_16430 [Gammaproteobacteria bacterium]|nr:hypothetical protein [Gammaproteobacteria bacterium]MBU1656378.1 hypothetical protein [Gammaproteobacteria bacterium]MBU1962134.1 hypothetical protein [Gammaproteobacteria bacterium]